MNRRALLAFAAVGLLRPVAAAPETDTASGYGADQFLLLPLRMHLLRSRTVPELDCRLKEADAERILGKVNRIWGQAGISFFAEAILAEDAASQDLFGGLGANRTEGHLQLVRPRSTRTNQVVHTYFVHQMRPNGICFQQSPELIFVKDAAELDRVAGGADEYLPRVTAHEIGHALGLEHRQDTFNLMASGTTGYRLNEAEVATARKGAEALSYHLSAAAALVRADREAAAGGSARAAALYTAVAGLPAGDLASAARERLRKLSGTSAVHVRG